MPFTQFLKHRLTDAAFKFSRPPFRLVKRIPRGAHPRPASIFESCLRDVVRDGSLSSWERLLSFAAALCPPSRGGWRINLSTCILAQLEVFDASDVMTHITPNFHKERRKEMISSQVDSERKLQPEPQLSSMREM